jgi:hypothetical protein
VSHDTAKSQNISNDPKREKKEANLIGRSKNFKEDKMMSSSTQNPKG